MNHHSRRAFLASGFCGCALGVASMSAWGKTLPTDLTSLVTHGYQPIDQDERGMWQSCEKLEEQLALSNRQIEDPTLTSYLIDVVTSLTDGLTTNVRVYPLWEADFNAAMLPTGVMIVNSGFLARVRNEAQLAAVLGHECGHFLRRHSLKNWRSMRSKAAFGAFVAAGAGIATGATGQNWYDLANAINQNLMLSIFQFSRELESEADAFGLKLLAQRSYSPESAGEVWAQLIEERKASAQARKQKYKEGRSAFSTHPPASDRMEDLAATAKFFRMRTRSEQAYDDRREAYINVIRDIRPRLIEEQVKLNDPGASLYLINNLAQDGWDGQLRYFEGEVYRMRSEDGDADRAAAAFARAVAFANAPPEAYRAHGHALMKAGDHEGGKQQLRRYLELAPNASDLQMIEFTLKQ